VRNWFYIVIIILLTAGVVVVWETPPEMLLPGDREAEDKAQLFSVIDNAQVRHFNEEGELSYSFAAEELRHYRHEIRQVSDDDYTLVTEPEVTFYTDNPPWHMRAASGKLTDRGLTLTLSDNVRIWQTDESDPESRTSELSTETLVVRPMEKTAYTDAPVTIETAMGAISAVGMSADLRNQNIRFLSNVQGHYEPM
jgi:LPS export ABC transporter protein LptC